MQFLTQVGITMAIISKTPKEGIKQAKARASGERVNEGWAVCMLCC